MAAPTGADRAAAERASDALARVLRSVRLAPDPVAVWLVCAEGPERLRASRYELAVRLPGCVQGLPVSGYLELALAGATSIGVMSGPCCAGLGEPLELVDARALLAAHGHSAALSGQVPARRHRLTRAKPVPDAATLPIPRRALLNPLALTRLPYRPPTERERLLAALEELGEATPRRTSAVGDGSPARATGGADDEPKAPSPDRTPVHSERPASEPDPRTVATAGEPFLSSAPPRGAIFEAAGCTACAVCVKGCPRGALAIEGEPPVLTLTQDASRCTDCGECVRLCPDDALVRIRPLTWPDLQERTVRPLATVETVTCARCRQPVAVAKAEDGLCPVCAYRRKNPFGSALPPHLVQQ